jgi:hypothetical protein
MHSATVKMKNIINITKIYIFKLQEPQSNTALSKHLRLWDAAVFIHTPIQREMMIAKQGTTKTDIMVKDWWLAPLHKSASHVSQKSTFTFPSVHFVTEPNMAQGSTASLFATEQARNVCLFPDWSERTINVMGSVTTTNCDNQHNSE